ncbi:MAG: NACHT domain-containing protein, partial [Promethearchaeota archaeon]
MSTENQVKRLVRKLKLIRCSLQCPNCGALTGDLSGKTKFRCQYCKETFNVDSIDPRTKETLSWKKLKEMADVYLDMMTITMRSRMDIQYDPERFIERSKASESFLKFLNEIPEMKRLYVLLGEAGLGKTWLVANWATTLAKQGYIIFYVCLRDGINNFFDLTFASSFAETTQKIDDIPASQPGSDKIIWIMDGYDEITDDDERKILLVKIMNYVEKRKNQYLVITSRGYDWNRCLIRKNQQPKIQRMLWKSNQNFGSNNASFQLLTFSPDESKKALEKYKLPPIEKWNPQLKKLAKYPLWIQIIAEWHETHQSLPRVNTLEIYQKYFKRMQLEFQHLRLLANTENQLMEPVIRISTKTFTWFGTAYYCRLLKKSNKTPELASILKKVNDLPSQDKNVIISLLSNFGISPVTIDQEKIDEIQRFLVNAHRDMDARSWSTAMQQARKALDLATALNQTDLINRARDILGRLTKMEALEKKFNNAITNAKQQLNSRNYSNARSFASEASNLANQLDDPKLVRIVSDLLSRITRLETLEANYRRAMDAAEDLINAGN